MKQVQRFKCGETIPSNAKFIGKHICDGTNEAILFYEIPIKEQGSKTKTVETFIKEIECIVNHLNKHTGKKYSPKTEKTRKLIFKWLKQGYTVADFYVAIDNMVEEWGTDPKMSVYLRPETLFGTKFEGYYNRNSSNQENPFDDLDNIMSGIN